MQGGRNVHITIGGVIPFNLIKLVTKFESRFYLVILVSFSTGGWKRVLL